MTSPVGMPIRTPNTVTKEGGMNFGSFSIQSMNTTALMQMYQNTANIYGSITEFGTEMFELAYKYTTYKAKKDAAIRKAGKKTKTLSELDPEVKEDHDTARAREEHEKDRRQGTGSGLGSLQSTRDESEVAQLGDTTSIPSLYEDVEVAQPDPRYIEEEDYR